MFPPFKVFLAVLVTGQLLHDNTAHAHTPSSQSSSAAASQDTSSGQRSLILHRPVLEQLHKGNKAISPAIVHNHSLIPSGLWVLPLETFSIGFLWDTFLSDGGWRPITYHGLLGNGSELPPWISFNTREITFDGRAPSIEGFETIRLALVAKMHGQSVGVQFFNLTVGCRDISFRPGRLSALKGTAGSAFEVKLRDVILPSLLLNGRQASDKILRSLNFTLPPNAPSWVSVQNASLAGTFPLNGLDHIELDVRDAYDYTQSNPLFKLRVSLRLDSPIFRMSALNPLTVEAGSDFTYDFSPYLNAQESSEPMTFKAAFVPSDAMRWMQFRADPPSLSGKAPRADKPTNVNVTLTASLNKPNLSGTITLPIRIQGVTQPSAPYGPTKSARPSSVGIVVGCVIGLLFGFVVLCLAMAYFRRQWGRKEELDATDDVEGNGGDDEASAQWEIADTHGEHIEQIKEALQKLPHNEVLHSSTTVPKAKFFSHLRKQRKAPESAMSDLKSERSLPSQLKAMVFPLRPAIVISKPLPIAEKQVAYEPSVSPHTEHIYPDLDYVVTPRSYVPTQLSTPPHYVGPLSDASCTSSESSLEGGVSVGSSALAGLVSEASHVWVHKAGTGSKASRVEVGGAQTQYRMVIDGLPPSSSWRVPVPRPMNPTAALLSHSTSSKIAERTALKPLPPSSESSSEISIDEGIVQLAYAINISDHPIDPKRNRSSTSLPNPYEHGKRTSQHRAQRLSRSDPSMRVTNPFASSASLANGSQAALTMQSSGSAFQRSSVDVAKPAVIQTNEAMQAVPATHRGPDGNVSRVVDYGLSSRPAHL